MLNQRPTLCRIANFFVLRSKIQAKVFGVDVDEVLERARLDLVEQRRANYRDHPDPYFLTFGPKTRQEFFANLTARGGWPF